MQANTSYGCASIVILVTCCALLVCWPLAEVLTLDPRPADLVAIGKVVEDPQHFNLHRVRFQGTITKITALPNQGGCGTFPGYVFQFQDETGSIEVFDIGWCSEGSSAAPLLVGEPSSHRRSVLDRRNGCVLNSCAWSAASSTTAMDRRGGQLMQRLETEEIHSGLDI